MEFQDLDLHPALKKAIQNLNYTNPTPIQEQAIPLVQEGKDILASAQTGTGKTAAFLLPVLNRLAKLNKNTSNNPKVLILVPTRELALQVSEEAEKYSKFLSHIKVVTIFGGVPYPVQKRKLSKPYDILVATPGRLMDHMEKGKISLKNIETFILDEADRMLDMGFIDDVDHISETIPKNSQTLLFSATLNRKILSLAKDLLKDPEEIEITPKKSRHENIEQKIHNVDDLHHKHRLLEHLLTDETLNQAIVFTSTKSYADELVDDLKDNGHKAAALHGDMNQRKRTKTITQMRNGKIRILVATDVAARGIDVPTISHVINFDLPRTAEEYVHRIGRTGRAGANGLAFSFVSHKDRSLVREIELYTGQNLKPTVIEGYEAKSRNEFAKKSRSFKRGGFNSKSSGFKRGPKKTSFRGSRGRKPEGNRSFSKDRDSQFSDSPRGSRDKDSSRSPVFSRGARRGDQENSRVSTSPRGARKGNQDNSRPSRPGRDGRKHEKRSKTTDQKGNSSRR